MTRPLTLESAVNASRDLVRHVGGMTGGKASLTGEYPDVYVLDHLLAPHFGSEDVPAGLKDFALSAGVYAAVLMMRLWRDVGQVSSWREDDLTACGVEVDFQNAESEDPKAFVLTVPSDFMGLVLSPPNPFPLFEGAWVTTREGDPLLPKYVFGGLLLSHPLSKGDATRQAPGGTPFLRDHMDRMLSVLSLSCARDILPEEGFRQRLAEEFYACCLWPAVGDRGNDYGTENLRSLVAKVAYAGPENREEVTAALEAMEKGWMAEGSYVAGLALRALQGREDIPDERLGFHVPEVRDVLAEAARLFGEAGLLSAKA